LRDGGLSRHQCQCQQADAHGSGEAAGGSRRDGKEPVELSEGRRSLGAFLPHDASEAQVSVHDPLAVVGVLTLAGIRLKHRRACFLHLKEAVENLRW
jgi:hypothetical protein